MKLLAQYLAVGAAGSLGAMLRLAVSTFCGQWFGTAFPIGTLVINLSGSLFLGWFLTLIGERYVVSDTTRMAVAVGFVAPTPRSRRSPTNPTRCWKTALESKPGPTCSAALCWDCLPCGWAFGSPVAEEKYTMSIQGEQVLLRVYLQSADRMPHTPTYERIVRAARNEGLAGATTLRGSWDWARMALSSALPGPSPSIFR